MAADDLKVVWPRELEFAWHDWHESRYQYERDIERPPQEWRVVPFQVPGSWGDERLWLPNGNIVRRQGPLNSSRLFASASSQYLQVDAIPTGSGSAWTFACWFYPDSTGVDMSLVWVGDKDLANMWSNLYLFNSGVVAMDERTSVVNIGAASTGSWTSGSWQHAAGEHVNTTSRYAWYNGSVSAENTTLVNTSGFDRTAIGRRGDSTPSTYMNGRICEVGSWSTNIGASAMGSLYAGKVTPLAVRTDVLLTYLPLVGQYSPEIDVCGNLADLTVTGATTSALEPGIRRRSGYMRRFTTNVASTSIAAISGYFHRVGGQRR